MKLANAFSFFSSMTAMTLDLLVVILLANVLVAFFEAVFLYSPAHHFGQWVMLVAFSLALVLYLLVVEVAAAGTSLGRLFLGLSIKDTQNQQKPSLPRRLKRFLVVLSSLGLRSFNPQSLPAYNKHPSAFLKSDWIGSVVEGAQTTAGPVSGSRKSQRPAWVRSKWFPVPPEANPSSLRRSLTRTRGGWCSLVVIHQTPNLAWSGIRRFRAYISELPA